MNVHQVARLMHYSERHVKRLAREGKLPARKVRVRRTVYIVQYVFPDDLLEQVSYEPYESKCRKA